jgi:hypothetical protein
MKLEKHLLFIISLTLLVGCSNDKETEDFVAKCKADPTGCEAMYKNAYNSTQVAGSAANSGLSQVAQEGAKVEEGQVPSTKTLPASITEEQIRTKAAQVKSELNAYEGTEQTNQPAVNSYRVSSVGSMGADVGVTRVPESVSESKALELAPAIQESQLDQNGNLRAIGRPQEAAR